MLHPPNPRQKTQQWEGGSGWCSHMVSRTALLFGILLVKSSRYTLFSHEVSS